MKGSHALIEARPPNVLFILADDVGHADVGWTDRPAESARSSKTPRLDSLAQQGLRLDRHYTFKYCSPSRVALQSGRNPLHANVWNGLDGMPQNMTGLGHAMSRGGYRSFFVGKWDAGCTTQEHTPLGRGYERFFGFFGHSNDYW